MTTSPDTAEVYEVTIEGALGPLLLHALGPYVDVRTQRDWVLVTRRGPGAPQHGLIDVLAALEAEGCDVVDITVHPPERSTAPTGDA